MTDGSNFCTAAVKSWLFKEARIINYKMIRFPTKSPSVNNDHFTGDPESGSFLFMVKRTLVWFYLSHSY